MCGVVKAGQCVGVGQGVWCVGRGGSEGGMWCMRGRCVYMCVCVQL